MSIMHCYWAFLSLERFEYVFLSELVTGILTPTGVSSENILLSQSLLRFIHPDEVDLAENDLLNFTKVKTLAGAVTRCRLRNILSPERDNWVITDVIMYIATNKIILTLFHHKPQENKISDTKPCCGGDNAYSLKPSSILNALQLYSSPVQNQNPFCIFQIYNTNSQQLVLSWPPLPLINPPPFSSNEKYSQQQQEELKPEDFSQLILSMTKDLVSSEMDKSQKFPRSNVLCMHHYRASSTAIINPYGLFDIERIIICYKDITFGLFQVLAKEQFSKTHDLILINKKSRALDVNDSDNANMNIKNNKITAETAAKTSTPSACWKGRFNASRRKCVSCHTSNSPEWRRGPAGHKKLCNACGLRYARSIAKKNK